MIIEGIASWHCRQLRCVWEESMEEHIQAQIDNYFSRGFSTSRNIKYTFKISGKLYPEQDISVSRQAFHVDFCLDVLQPQLRVAFAHLLWLLLLSICFLALYFFGIFFLTLLYTAPPLGTPLARAPFAAIERFRLEIAFEAGNDLSMLLLLLLWLRFSSVPCGSLWELFNCDEYLVKVTQCA